MCIVLDYASGGELFEFVADKRAIASEADIQFIFAQIVDGTVIGNGRNKKQKKTAVFNCCALTGVWSWSF